MDVDLAKPPGAGVDEGVGLVGRDDDELAATDDTFVYAVGERRLAVDDEEELRVDVLVKARPPAGFCVHEDYGRRNPAVVVADQLACKVALLQIGRLDEPDRHVSSCETVSAGS